MKLSYTSARYHITVLLLAIVALAQANTITVDSTHKTMGTISLRTAVATAAPGDTIRFSSMIDGDTIKLTGSEITLDKNLVIIGNPAASAGQVSKTIIDGMNTSRIFRITSGDTVSIIGVKMQRGNGVGVRPPALFVTIGGAIYNQGTLFLTNSTVSSNSAVGGGGIYNENTTLTLTNSTVSGNSADIGGGGILNEGTTNLINSTVSGNSATGNGGGIGNGGTATLINSTVSGNSADIGGGINNPFPMSLTLTNSIIAKNVASKEPDIFSAGNLTDGGHNLIGISDDLTVGITTLRGTVSAPLDPLFAMDVPTTPSNGGDLRLQCGSPAIDMGNDAANTRTKDILGNPRKVGTIDIGAYERPADTGTKMVTTLADDGLGSLRDLVCTACPGDTIRFSPLLDGDTIKLTGGEITLDKNLVIIGNPAASAGQVSNTIIDGMANSRIFHIPSGDTVSIVGVKMQGGNGAGFQPSGFTGESGGAVFNDGDLAISNCMLSGNNVSSSGGGIHNFENGMLTIINSAVTGNSASSGGGISNQGTLEVTRGIVSGNSSSIGGGMHNFPNGTLIVINSAISGNSATNNGGGIYNNILAVLSLTNSTVTGNSATAMGGGIFNPDGILSGTATLANSILALNTATDDPNISGSITNNGNNLIGVDPLFVMDVPAAPSTGGDLRLRCGSPAINMGNDAANTTTEDILGNPRKVSTIDIGAYERPADTGTKMVTTLADDGLGSLRDLARTACPGDTIRFSSILDGDTIKLTSGEITIDTSLVIIGNDTTNTIIDGMATSRIFDIPSGDTVSLISMTLQGGNGVSLIQPFSGTNGGGAIYNQGFMIITNSTVRGSSSLLGLGGGIYNSGKATLTTCTVSGNGADDGRGGGIYNSGEATLTNCKVNGNSAHDGSGGGIFNDSNSTLTLTNSTVNRNSTSSGYGAGISNSGMATLINSTVGGNTASSGAGISNSGMATLANCTVTGNSSGTSGGGIYNSGVATLANCTVTGNLADEDDGGGIFNNSNSTMTLTNSIIAKNVAPSGADIQNDGSLIDVGHNLIGDGSGQLTLLDGTNGNIVGTTAMPIDPLFVMDVPVAPSMGGDLRLQCGSPAIDAGSNTAASSAMVPTTDINGNPRIITKTIDIGAYEFQVSEAPTPITLVTNTNDAGCGSLRFAVCNAMPGDTIRFDASLNGDTIKLNSGEITLDKNLVIIGNPAASAGQVSNTIIDGMDSSRIFHILSGTSVTIEGIRIQGGNGMGVQPFVIPLTYGGAIFNEGTLTMMNSAVSGNSASGGGGGIFNEGSAFMNNSTVSGNSSPNRGGGIYNSLATLSLTNSTVSGNSAPFNGGGIYNSSDATLTLTNSVVGKNSSTSGPDISNFGILTDGGHNLIGISDGLTLEITTLKGTATAPLDPLFVMDVPVAPSSGGDLRLRCASPAINMGNDAANNTTEDILGNPRKVGTIDIGAYERHAMPGIIEVTVTGDSGIGSLRNAVVIACSGDTIRFSSMINGDTIKLTSGEITLDKNLVIMGNPAASAGQVSNTIIDGMAKSRIFHIPTGDSVSIAGIAIKGGSGASPIQPLTGIYGGAIYNAGCLTLTNSTVDGNSADTGGGIFNTGALTLTNSTVSGNDALSGGGISNNGTLTLNISTISGNDANSGGGIYNVNTVNLISSTVSGNSASNDGGGIYNLSTTTLINSTVSGNSASNTGGGIYNSELRTATLINSTVSGNSADTGGGIYNDAFATLTLTNSIIAKNVASGGPDVYSATEEMDGRHNLIGDGSGQSAIVDGTNGNIVGTTAMPIDPLFVMDVPTAPSIEGDLRLQCASSAIDAGTSDTTGLNIGLVDLGGLSRIAGGRVDIGAHEAATTLSVDTSTINAVSSSDTYIARENITSDANIPPNRSIVFKAGQGIELTSGFTVEQLATLVAIIESCN